jgi:16S rRNA (uracil1498-N3)-methyltransferase
VTVPRIHVEAPLGAGASVELEGPRAHYVAHVLRSRVGREVRLFNLRDGEWRCRIGGVARHRVSLEVTELLRAPVDEAGPTLVFAPIRQNRLDWLVEKAVELGVGRFAPVLTRHTVVRLGKLDRLRAIAVEAAEQSGRMGVPCMEPSRPLEDWLACRDPALPLLFADERGGGQPALRAAARCGAGPSLLVGPEGGFALEEREAIRGAPGTVPVDLGPLVLRAETAALMLLAVSRATREPSPNSCSGRVVRA